MEKIYFDNSTYIWKTKLNMLDNKQHLLKWFYKMEMEDFFSPFKDVDAYPYYDGMDAIFDEIMNKSWKMCKSLYIKNYNIYNKFNADAWINVTRSKKPVQREFVKGDNDVYHITKDDTDTILILKLKKNKKVFFHITHGYIIYKCLIL